MSSSLFSQPATDDDVPAVAPEHSEPPTPATATLVSMAATLAIRDGNADAIRAQLGSDDAILAQFDLAVMVQSAMGAGEGIDSPLQPSWAPVDHDEAIASADNPQMTDVGRLSGEAGLCLFYRRKVNSLFSPSEGGKTWAAQHCAVQEIAAGHRVLYVDFEDDAGSVYRRMRLLGATDSQLRDHFVYIAPSGPLTPTEKPLFIGATTPVGTLAVLDGVTEAMALENLTGRDEGDVAKFHMRYSRPLAKQGWAVVLIDHTPHEEKRAIGSQHKRSAISGAAYLLEPVDPIAAGRRGMSRLKVDKDRGGWVRAHAAQGKRPQWVADMVIDFSAGSTPHVALYPAAPKDDADGAGFAAEPPKDVCAAIVGFLVANPGSGTTAIRSGVRGGSTGVKSWALQWLIEKGHVTASKDGRTVAHRIGPTPFAPS